MLKNHRLGWGGGGTHISGDEVLIFEGLAKEFRFILSYGCGNSPGHITGVCSLSLLQGIFPTQGSNPGLPYYRRILYQLSHNGSPLSE